MSWDVVVVKDADGRRPLGSRAEVQAAIDTCLPEFDVRVGPAVRIYQGMGFGIEFCFGAEDPVKSIYLHVAGFGDPISVMVRLARPNGWTLIDCGDGEMIDLDHPSYEGWATWQMFAYGRRPSVALVRWAGEPRVLNLKYAPTPENAPHFAADIVRVSQEVMGVALDGTPAGLSDVDSILGRLADDGETFRSLAETVFGFGCYIGEVMIRASGAVWATAGEAPPGLTAFPLALLLPREAGFADPLGVAVRRLERVGTGLVLWAAALRPAI